MKNAVLNTLQKNELRHTGCREDTLLLFFDEDTALSHGNLEKTLGQKYDRVTIYRTLKTFVEKGILHKVLDEDGLRMHFVKKPAPTITINTTTYISNARPVAKRPV